MKKRENDTMANDANGPRSGEDPNKYTWSAWDIVMLDKNGDPISPARLGRSKS